MATNKNAQKWVGMGIDTLHELWIFAYLAQENRTAVHEVHPRNTGKGTTVYCKETGEKFNHSTGSRLFPPYEHHGWKHPGLVNRYTDANGVTFYEYQLTPSQKEVLRVVKSMFDSISWGNIS